MTSISLTRQEVDASDKTSMVVCLSLPATAFGGILDEFGKRELKCAGAAAR